MTYIHTQPWAIYNEIDEYAAEWIENLIARGLVAPGIVDRRSIEDVRADDLRGFRQVHLFAGIAVWSYAARRAGISDDTALWTLSCPCQPFSAAGKGTGVDDERHLWPAAYHLIRECRPPKVYGEQVASKDGLGWLDLVFNDMEGADYAFGALDTSSALTGAPHIRQRLRFHAYDLRSSASGMEHSAGNGWIERRAEPGWRGASSGCSIGGMGNNKGCAVENQPECAESYIESRSTIEFRTNTGTTGGTCCWNYTTRSGDCRSTEAVRDLGGMDNDDDEGLEGFGSRHCASLGHGQRQVRSASETGEFGGVVNPNGRDSGTERKQCSREQRQQQANGRSFDKAARARPTNGFWRDADWLFCRDGKWRPVESGSFPLVDGSAFRLGSGSAFEGRSRQGMLKAYGNAVDAEATREFIEATLERETLDLLAMGTDFDDVLG